MDLLLISNENKSHYVYIKDFNRFICNKIRCKKKKYFCKFISLLKQFLKSIIIVVGGRGEVIKKHFNKNLIMSAGEERFQLSNSCWICNKLFNVGDDKVRDHCHITGKSSH